MLLLKLFKRLPLGNLWFIIGVSITVGVMEFATPPDYVFGYLYIGPILLVNYRFGQVATLSITAIACLLTILNIWIPGYYPAIASTIASRLIAAIALIVTAILSDRNHKYHQKLLQQEAKLQAQEKLALLREDFASTLTHDLKTPLLGAIETLEAFQRGYLGSIQPAQKVVIETIIRSHQTSLQLVETLLDIYRNDTEGLNLKLAPVDLVEIAHDVTTTLVGLSLSRRVHISFNYGTSDFRQFLWVNGDAFQLSRVFTNLLTNAINHSLRGSKVEVVLESGSRYHTAKIIDSGAGILPEQLPYLFERFYQGYSDRQAKGSGLGLYLTRQIVETHGGTIWAENRSPHGAVFAFRLPILIIH